MSADIIKAVVEVDMTGRHHRPPLLLALAVGVLGAWIGITLGNYLRSLTW
jgi:hypothetical protein